MTGASSNGRPDLIRGVAHLLRTPLGVVLGLSATLRDYDDRFTAEQRVGYLGDILTAAEEMSVALDGLSLLARLLSGALPVSPRPTPLRDLLTAGATAMTAVWGEDTLIADDSPAGEVWADKQRVNQALEAIARATTPLAGITRLGVSDGRVALSIGPVRSALPADELEEALMVASDSPEMSEWLARPAGWSLILARCLLEAQDARLTCDPLDEGVRLVISFGGNRST